MTTDPRPTAALFILVEKNKDVFWQLMKSSLHALILYPLCDPVTLRMNLSHMCCLPTWPYFGLPTRLPRRLWAQEGCGNVARFSSHSPHLHAQLPLQCGLARELRILLLIFTVGFLFIDVSSLHFSSRESGLCVETWHCHTGDPKHPVIGEKKYIYIYTHWGQHLSLQ